MEIFAIALFLGLVAMFMIRAGVPWTMAHGGLSARDRWSLITSFVVAITNVVIAPLLINWLIVPTAIWLTAVALLTAGVAGAVLRWPELAWFSGTHPIRCVIGIGATLVSCALLIGVAVT